MAFFAAFRYWRSRATSSTRSRAQSRCNRRDSVGALAVDAPVSEPVEMREARYWDWVAQWGAIWAVGVTLLQPWLGYSYAKEVQLHEYPAWFNMMFGDLSNVFLVQITSPRTPSSPSAPRISGAACAHPERHVIAARDS